MIDQINIEETVNKIFMDKKFSHGDKEWTISGVDFDIIKNRFVAAIVSEEEERKQIIDRNLFNTLFDSLASTPAGQPFVAEEGEFESKEYLVEVLKSGEGKKVQLGILSTDIGRKGKEITGPQIAAEDMRRLIREVRNKRPDIDTSKNQVKSLILEKYPDVFAVVERNAEIDRYNFWLWQMEQMRKVRLVRIDRPKEEIDLSNLKKLINVNRKFQPLLVTPNMNLELSAMSETYRQLLHLPNMDALIAVFNSYADKIYVVSNYTQETQINNIIVQLLLLNRHILSDDLTKGILMHKVDRETIAAAKQASLEMVNAGKK